MKQQPKELQEFTKQELKDSLTIFKQNPIVENTIGAVPVYNLKNKLGNEGLVIIVMGIVSDAMQYFNSTRPMNDAQIEMYAEEFVRIRTHDSLQDLICMLEMAKHGKLSKHYGSIDPAKLTEWWGEYMELKCYQVERINDEDKKKLWSESNQVKGVEPDKLKALIETLDETNTKRLKDKIKNRQGVKRESFDDWLESFKTKFPDMNEAEQDKNIKHFEESRMVRDGMVLESVWSDLYEWCIINKN